MSYILIEPKIEADIAAIERVVDRLGYRALTRGEFVDRTSHFYTYQTGFGTNVLSMTVISFVVGLSISGQTLYTFILENLEHFGVPKVTETRGRELVTVIVFQTTSVALVGCGLGIGLCAASIVLVRLRIPNRAVMIIFASLMLALATAIVIAGMSGYIGVRKVFRIEPFDIFRG